MANLSLSNFTYAPQAQPLVGWTPEVRGRGTWSLLVSCLSTTLLCTWVVIHPRVDSSVKIRILHKIALFIKTVIAPEFIAVEAAQEWTQARRIRNECAKWTEGEFKIIHAFYIGMLGIRYRDASPDPTAHHSHTTAPTKVLWPNQYVWLLQNGHVLWDAEHQKTWGLIEAEINDKSNADSVAKFIAVVGVAKFLVDSLLRVVHRLPLAPLESMTLGYVPLFALSYFFWWLKPKDIHMPTVVDLPSMEYDALRELEALALTDAFDDHGNPGPESMGNVWRLMPRDFELELFRDELPTVRRGYGQGAVLANWDPDLYHSPVLWPLTCVFGVSFGALHLVCWNTVLPTVFEMWSWRVSAIVSMVAMLIFMQFRQVILQWSKLESQVSFAAAVLYLVSRMFALVEAFASLRGLEPAVYQS